MADFRVNVTAETREAERKLREVDRAAEQATKTRSIKIDTNFVQDTSKRFKDLQSNLKDAANNVQTFYRVSKNIPGIGERVREFESLAKGTADLAKNAPASAAALRENAKAGSILANSFETAGGAAGRLINTLAKTGFALFAVKEAVGVLKGAFSGFFNETIGREVKLRETILKTQTTLASTNKVFRGGSEITDPYEKIVSLTGEVGRRIDSIRERSIALAGVTSNDVIEVFGIVASQVGQIGGGLKEAEDLAINFAAALGTFGIPLYQARQEVGSILRGDITMDSYLAKALGITNQDIARAKSEAGGVVKFLEERLAAAVAGQRIAAQGFSGVVSNILDLWELLSQRFGAGLLDPLLGGLSSTFEFLFQIREQIFAIADAAGRGIGQTLGNSLTLIGGGSALFGQLGAGAEDFAASLAATIKKAFVSLQADANQVIAPIRNLLEELTKSIGLVGAGLARLAQGFISIKTENFKALVQIFSNLSEAVSAFSAVLGQVLRAYGQLLQVPFVQYLSQISAQFQILEKIGVMSAVKLGFAAVGLIAAWTPLVTFFQGLVAKIAALVGGLIIAVGAAFTRIGAVVAAFAATLTTTYPAVEALKQQLLGLSASLTTAGAAADKAGTSVTRLGGATAGAARTVSTAILSFVKFNLILLGVQLAITVLIDLFGRLQRAQENQQANARATEALRRLATTYKDVDDSADSATKSARDFEQAIVNANYSRNIEELEKVREKINQIRYELKPGIQSWGEFWDAASGAEIGRFEEAARQRLQGLLREEQQIKAQLRGVDAQRDKQRTEDNIRLEANNRVNLEKEIGEVRRQQDSQLFQLRQQQAQKEVEIFRLAGELRIFQMEQANKKLIEGEEGASAAALESLNNYLSIRERGELDIEASKKEIAIEAANLERQISDYRLENEKKIAEIRKRAGDYEQKVSDYRRQQAAATGAAPGVSAGFLVGSTGRSSGPHLDLRSPTGDKQAVINEAVAIIKAWQQQNLAYIQLSNAKIDVKNMTDEGKLRQALAKEQQVHGRRSGGGAIDIAVPEGTLVPTPVGTPSWGGAGGWQATSLQTGNLFLHGLGTSTASPGAQLGAPAAPITPPAAPTFDDIGAPAVAKYAEAVNGLGSAMQRLRALQAALTDARTAAAFESIAKAAFPKVALEGYQDSLTEARLTYEAIALASSEAFDPERTALAVQANVQIIRSNKELAQILEGVSARENLSAAEKKKLIEQTTKAQADYVAGVREAERLQSMSLGVKQAGDFLKALKESTKATYDDVAAITLRNKLQVQGLSPERIQAELNKVKIEKDTAEQMQRINTLLTSQLALRAQLEARIAAAAPKDKAELQRQLTEALAVIATLQAQLAALPKDTAERSAAEDALAQANTPSTNPRDIVQSRINELQKEAAALTNLGNMAVTVADGIGSAFSTSFKGIIDGSMTARQALGNFFQSLADMFLEMAAQMIAKMITMAILNQVLGVLPGFSGGGGFGGGYFNPMTGLGAAGPNFGFANGGVFAQNGIQPFAKGGIVNRPTLFKFAKGGAMSTGLMGEAGPEAIMPLRRGSDGNLGVMNFGGGSGSGVTNVTVNVDASGTKTQGDSAKGEQLGRAVSQAVQDELLRQKRPGGLLA